MKQIYSFEKKAPPVLNESMIYAKIEKRKVYKQTALFAVAGILQLIAVMMFAFVCVKLYPWIAIACFAYVLLSIIGCGAIAVVYTRKGGLSI